MEHTISKTTFIGFTTVAAIMGIGFALAMGASADVGIQRNGASFVRQNCTSERHAQMQEAITNRDYDAWVALMEGKGRVTEVVTRDNFETFARMREAMFAGENEEAQALREELGFHSRTHGGEGYHRGKHAGMGGKGMHGRYATPQNLSTISWYPF